jgi:hypothetical protein
MTATGGGGVTFAKRDSWLAKLAWDISFTWGSLLKKMWWRLLATLILNFISLCYSDFGSGIRV